MVKENKKNMAECIIREHEFHDLVLLPWEAEETPNASNVAKRNEN